MAGSNHPPTFGAGWLGLSGHLAQSKSLSSFLSALFSHSYLFDSVKLLILGSVIETGRRTFKWLMERFRLQYSTTAQFDEGDPAYEWIVLFLTQKDVWRRSRDFRVSAKNSTRKWGIKTEFNSQTEGSVDYVPTYDAPQLFRWKGYWLEIKRDKSIPFPSNRSPGPTSMTAIIYVTIYTLDTSVLSMLVEEARQCYIDVTKPNIIIHSSDNMHGPAFIWNNVKRKVRRPLNSIVLQEGVLESLVEDAQEFISTEDWYIEAGVPYRRGYLLYGPPGTGKSSTIYALAGELGLEIYILSLSSSFVDDNTLQRAASSVPKHGILLIEDIDCAFPSREDSEDDMLPTVPMSYPGTTQLYHMPPPPKSAVTLSGLLNVIDGVASEEGKLFFATTNYIDRLDPALLRPGRIDKKLRYSLATRKQAFSLFTRFFPESRFGAIVDNYSNGKKIATKLSENLSSLLDLAETFAAGVPEQVFSTAEIQGYLLSCKMKPIEAATGVEAWIEQEYADRQDREEQENQKKLKIREAKEKREASQWQGPPVAGGVPSFYPQVHV